MENTLLCGDVVLAGKFHYGARLPISPYEIPFVEIICYLCGIHQSFQQISWKSVITPGFIEIKPGDVVIFRYPNDRHSIFIKRCVALPGDTICIKRNQVYLDNKMIEFCENIQYTYNIKIENNDKNNFSFLDNSLKSYYDSKNQRWRAILDNKTFKQIKPIVKNISKCEEFGPNIHIFPNDSSGNWNRDNFGPLLIPQKGLKVELSCKNISLYKNTIEKFENCDIDMKDSNVYIDGQLAVDYTFKYNYYFMLGDNRHNSIDSRYWGLVPESHIIGKAVYVCWSYDKRNQKMRNSRILKKIQ